MRPTLHRVVALTFAVLVTAAAAGARPGPAAAADLTIGAAETAMVKLLNAEREKAGLVPVRVDARLMTIARQRSANMARYHYFSHRQPDGRNVFDLIKSAGITWYGAGEIIAWNNWPTISESMGVARTGWMNSTGHRNIVLSSSYNYVGIGLAVESDGKKLWTGVFMKGPDRTGGWVKLAAGPEISLASVARYHTATVAWTGGDVRLVVLTAGLRHYQIQIRTDGGAWSWKDTSTTAKSMSFRAWRGHHYDVRVRACDRAGNCGGWATQHVVG